MNSTIGLSLLEVSVVMTLAFACWLGILFWVVAINSRKRQEAFDRRDEAYSQAALTIAAQNKLLSLLRRSADAYQDSLRKEMVKARMAVRDMMWLRYVWHDHDFDISDVMRKASHVCQRYGVTSLDECNELIAEWQETEALAHSATTSPAAQGHLACPHCGDCDYSMPLSWSRPGAIADELLDSAVICDNCGRAYVLDAEEMGTFLTMVSNLETEMAEPPQRWYSCPHCGCMEFKAYPTSDIDNEVWCCQCNESYIRTPVSPDSRGGSYGDL